MQCLLEKSTRSPKERTPTVYRLDQFWAELRTKLFAERHAPLSQPRNQEGFMCFPPMTHPSLPPLLDSKGHLPVNCQRSVSTKSYQWHPVLKSMSRTDTIPMNIQWLLWWFWKCYSPNALCQLYPQKKHSKLDKQRVCRMKCFLFLPSALLFLGSFLRNDIKASAKQKHLAKSNPMGDLKSFTNLDPESSK